MAIPLALCGKSREIIQGILDIFPSTYEFVHVCMDADTAVVELPALLKGTTITPSSGFGTNANATKSKIPAAIVIGGGFPTPEFTRIAEACNAVKPMPIFRADVNKGKTPGPPPPPVLAQRLIDGFDEVAAGKEAGSWEPGVYLY